MKWQQRDQTAQLAHVHRAARRINAGRVRARVPGRARTQQLMFAAGGFLAMRVPRSTNGFTICTWMHYEAESNVARSLASEE